MPRQPPPPIVHVRAEYESAVQAVLAKHGLAPEISRSEKPGVIELRFGQLSDADLLSWLGDVPPEALAYRAIVDGNPFDHGSS
jgi:hypothetical protein